MMLEEGAKVGCIEGNPVRADMEEILEHLSIDFILNVVLNEKKRSLPQWPVIPLMPIGKDAAF